MRIIMFAGPKGCGKDTAARYLLSRNQLLQDTMFKQLNFADTLKLAVEILFGFTQKELNDPALKEVKIERWPNEAPRTIMQNFANAMRTLYAPDIFVRRWKMKLMMLATNKNCILVTDLRHPEELEEARRLGAKIVYIHNAKVEAIRAAGIAAGDPLWCDSSEAFATLMKAEADIVVENDGESLDDFYINVHAAILELYGDWKDWQELAAVDPEPIKSPVII